MSAKLRAWSNINLKTCPLRMSCRYNRIMIKEVKIQNFRTFKYLEIRNFGHINVFIGKNNLGKSSLLEAIYLASDAVDRVNISSLYYILKRRGFVQRFKIEKEDDLEQLLTNFRKHIFYDGTNNAEIVIENNRSRKVRLSIDLFYDRIAVKNVFQKVIDELSVTSRITLIKHLPNIYFAATLSVNCKPTFVLFKGEGNIVRAMYLTYSDETDTLKFFLDTCYLCGNAERLTRFIKSLENILQVGTYSNLKEIISRFFDKKIKSFEPSFSDYFVKFDDKSIPFSMLGDGIRYFITHYLVLSVEKPSIVFLEEPENFMHPKMLDLLTELVVNTKHQVFIVTHSLEFLEKLLWHARESEADLKVFGFYDLEDGIPTIESYTLKEAFNSLYKLDIDLR